MTRSNQAPWIIVGVFAAVSLMAGEHAASVSCLRGSVACAMSRLWGSLLAASAEPASTGHGDGRVMSSSDARDRRAPVGVRDGRDRWDRDAAALVRDELLESGSMTVKWDFDGTSCRFVQEQPSGQGGHLIVG